MNPCEEFELLLSARLDGELTEAETARLETHLTHCPRCRALAGELQALEGLLSENLEEVPPALGQRLAQENWNRIPQQPPQSQAPVPSPKGRRSLLRGTCVAAAAVLLTVALVRIALPGGQAGSAADESMEAPSWSAGQSEEDRETQRENQAPAQPENQTGGQAESSPRPENKSDPSPADPPSAVPSSPPSESSSAGSAPPPSDASAGLVTEEEAQALVSDHLARQERSLTLSSQGLDGDEWVFLGKDEDGQAVARFAVSQSTGELREEALSGDPVGGG